jgi:long-chain acyl-CoA synthetase
MFHQPVSKDTQRSTGTQQAVLPTPLPLSGQDTVQFGGFWSKPTPPAPTAPQPTPDPESLVNIFVRHGSDPAVRDKKGIIISKHFAPNGQEVAYSYKEMLEGIQKTAEGLRRQGVKAGDRVAMLEMNTPEFLQNYIAGLALDATMVPINLLAMQDEKTKTDKFLYMLEKPQVNTVMIGEDPAFKALHKLHKIQRMQKLRGLLGPMLEREIKGEAARHCVERFIRKKIAGQAGSPQAVKDLKTMLDRLPKGLRIITPQDRVKLVQNKGMDVAKLQRTPKADTIADILYTSGTSGDPKGVLLSHGNLEFTVSSLSKIAESFTGKGDVMLMALPLFHIFGKAVQLTGLKSPTPVVMIPSLKDAKLQMNKVVDTIADYKVTVFPSVPVILEAFVKHLEQTPSDIPRVASIRTIISGGSALKADTFKKLQEMIPGIKIMEGYGSSEGGIDMLNREGIQGFVGPALPGVTVKINEPDPDTGAGEMWIQSPGVSKGYLHGTASADDQKVFSTDGWYRTGDVARFDDERQMFQIVGRNSDVIKVAGERRPAEEFELAMKETRLVSDAMAIAYKPDRETEKAVVVAITSQPGVTEASIKQAMGKLASEKTIAGWTIPKHIVVLNRAELPHGFIGFKRQYAATRDFVKKALAEGVVQFQDHADTQGKVQSFTVVPDGEKLNAFAEAYRYTPAAKKIAPAAPPTA